MSAIGGRGACITTETPANLTPKKFSLREVHAGQTGRGAIKRTGVLPVRDSTTAVDIFTNERKVGRVRREEVQRSTFA